MCSPTRNFQVLQESDMPSVDSGFIVLSNLRRIQLDFNAFCIEMPFVIFVEQGQMTCKIDEQDYSFHAGETALCMPHILLTEIQGSEDFEYSLLGFSRKDLIKNVLQSNGKKMLEVLDYKRSNPAVKLGDEEKEVFEHYFKLVQIQISNKSKPFYNELMEALFVTVFYEISGVVSSRVASDEYEPVHGAKRKDWMFRNFLRLLSEIGGRERSVGFYAEKLNISSKYLSNVIKDVSGKTAMSWIQQHTAELVARDLKYTDKSIKEIAYTYNFSNLSFFGKFCKKNLGCSPKAYRKLRRSEEINNDK